MKAFDAWLIELASAAPTPRYLGADGNEDVFWTSNPLLAKRFTTDSAALHFCDQHVEGATLIRRHRW